MNVFPRGAGAVALLLTLAASPAVHAQTYFSSNATISAATPGDVVIGYNNGSGTATASSPTVTLASSGSIGHDVRVYNGSVFTMNANVGGSLSAYGSSAVTVNSGTLSYALFADNNSTVNINGGTFSNSVEVHDDGTVNVSGGTFSSLYGYDGATINLFGALTAALTNSSFGYLGAYSQYTLSGNFDNNISANGTLVNIANGSSAHFTIGTNIGAVGPLNSVPEPGSMALLLTLSVTGAGFAAKRRRPRA